MTERAKNNSASIYYPDSFVEEIENNREMSLRETASGVISGNRATCKAAGNCGLKAFCGRATIRSEDQWGLDLLGNDGPVEQGVEIAVKCHQCTDSRTFAQATEEIEYLLTEVD